MGRVCVGPYSFLNSGACIRFPKFVVITTNLEAHKVAHVIVGQASSYLEVLGRISSRFLQVVCELHPVQMQEWRPAGSHVLLRSFSPSSQQHFLILRLISLSSLLPPPCLNLVL